MAQYRSSKLVNSFTVLGIILGISAIYAIVRHEQFILGAVFILTSAIIDRYDGRIARHFQLESDLGKRLDSYNDFISFALAPMVLLFELALFESSVLELFGILVFLLAAVFRLARFHREHTGDFVRGLPTTIAGLTTTFLLIIFHQASLTGFGADLLFFTVLLLMGLLMFSRLRVKKI